MGRAIAIIPDIDESMLKENAPRYILFWRRRVFKNKRF